MSEIIHLPNRYNERVCLIQLSESNTQYRLDVECPYLRIGENEDNTINFVDPSGGPFIYIGYKVSSKRVVSKIYRKDKDIIIELT